MRWCAGALLVVFACACGDDPSVDRDAGLFCEVSAISPVFAVPAVDLMFVIDDTPAMADLQDRLVTELARFAGVLESIEGGVPSLHVAIVSASRREIAFSDDPACPAIDGPFVRDIAQRWWRCGDDPTARCGQPNYAGALGDALGCLGRLGAAGEEPRLFDAALAAAATPGFLREGAIPAVVLITNADDVSSLTPAAFHDALETATGRPTLIAAVAPADATRLREAADEYVDVARDDWADALAQVAEGLRPPLGEPLVDGADLTDVDPAEPGLQLECVATMGDPEQLIPRCPMAAANQPAAGAEVPCYWVRDEPVPDVPGAVRTVTEGDAFPAPVFAELRCVGTCQ